MQTDARLAMVRSLPAFAAAGLLAAVATGQPQPPAAEARRILIVNTYGNRFAPFDAFSAEMRTAIAAGWTGPVEFLEVPLEMARFAQPAEQVPFVEYVRALLGGRRLDLVAAVGASAAVFVGRHRAELFGSVPVLICGLDARRLPEVQRSADQALVSIRLDPSGIVENILRVLPWTRRVVVVLGDSPVEKVWRILVEREFERFSGRVTFQWLNALPVDGMRHAVASLPPGSAVFFGTLNVDAAGVAFEAFEGLAAIRTASNAPVFGLFENQLGKGIVGGPLVSITGEGKRSARVALEILRGRPVADIAIPPAEPTRDVYDWRELRRWGIDRKRLPAGSELRYRPPSLWEAYRRQALIGFGVVAVESALIAALVAQRARRRRAEVRVRGLNRRLIRAQEDERKAIARELHDDFAQRLARLSIDVAQLSRASGSPAAAATAEMQGELSRMSNDVHRLAYQLHPSTLDDLGLTEALRIECDRVSRGESVVVRLQAPEAPPDLPRDTALGLFRIAQEALRNAVRHARPSAVDLALETTPAGVRLSIQDDGSGFDPEADRGRPSLGLASMRERAELFGGRIDIRSAPGRGTTIEAWAPAAARTA
jgi:signal transduction histidine kinase